MNIITNTTEVTLDTKPVRTKNAKPVYCITYGTPYASCTDAAEAENVHLSMISAVCLGKVKTCKGKQFCFVKDMPAHILDISNATKELIKDAAIYRKQEEERKAKEAHKVRQYGQWDGYPTSALSNIVEFLRKNGAIEHLKRNVIKCKFVPEDTNIFPARTEEIYEALFKIDYCHDPREKMERLAEYLGMDKEIIFEYMLATRDTGYEIPNVLIMPEADAASEIVLKQAYTNQCDWQIEAVNIIDFDLECVISYWHGKQMKFSFSDLPSEEQIEKFENGTN